MPDHHQKQDHHQDQKGEEEHDHAQGSKQLRLSHNKVTKYVFLPADHRPDFKDLAHAFEENFDDFHRARFAIEFEDDRGFVELKDCPNQMRLFHSHTPQPNTHILRSRLYTPDDLEKDALSVEVIVDAAVRLHQKLGKVLAMRLKIERCKSVLVVTKPGDPSIVPLTKKLALWFLENCNVDVHVGEMMKGEFDGEDDEREADVVGRIKFWTPEWVRDHYERIGLVVTMGGDGTVLFAAGLFQKNVPPFVSFHLGSLGFLTNFRFDEHARALDEILSGKGKHTTFRQRLCCTVYTHRADEKKEGPPMSVTNGLVESTTGRQQQRKPDTACKRDKVTRATQNGTCRTCETAPTGEPELETQVMNEVVLDRGANAGLLMLELYADDMYLTTIQADGLVVATATGSTAYSLSAGGSLVHPEKTAILITPICPHTLTCRPMILPSRTALRICVSPNSRVPAWVSFDGRDRRQLQKTDSVVVTASRFPLLQICHDENKDDWFRSLVSSLHWNEREAQKPLL
ncbi:hypothetical protein HKX48_008552 [Thoreauomyces humboldtii]|nr:hypothetical protein HKX48_008552 [Thoreauomyces humboldtii]